MTHPKATLFYVEDDESLSFVTRDNLELSGYLVTHCEDGKKALDIIKSGQKFDLCILDVMLPEVDGFTLAQEIRKRDDQVPIIFLTAKSMKQDKIHGLTIGADDYITKPFSMDVLLSRVKTALRHSHDSYPESTQIPISVGDIALDPNKFSATLGNQLLTLTPREFDLLLYFAAHANKVTSVEDILMDVWGEEWVGENQTVYVHICSLRKKIEADPVNPQRLLTIRGIGYKFVPQVAQ